VTINEEIPHVELPVTFAGNRNISVVPLEVFRVDAAKDKLATGRCIRVSVEPEREDVVLKKFLLFHALPVVAHRRKWYTIQVANRQAMLYINELTARRHTKWEELCRQRFQGIQDQECHQTSQG